MLKKIYFWVIVLYPFLYNNSQLAIRENQPLLSIFSIFRFIPKEIRYLEALFIISTFVIVVIGSTRDRDFIKDSFLTAVVMFLMIFSTAITSSSLTDGFQCVVIYLFPIIVFLSAQELRYSPQISDKAIRVLTIVGIINIPFAIFQLLVIRPMETETNLFNQGDCVVGLMSEAHTFAIFMYMLFFLYLYRFFLERKKLLYGLFAICFFFFGMQAQNDKATVFMIIVLLIQCTMYFVTSRYGRMVIFSLLSSCIIIFFAYINILEDNSLINIGVFRSYLNMPKALTESIVYPFFGSGAGSYASPMVMRNFYEKNQISPLARKYNYETISSSDTMRGFDWTTNLVSGYIVEFGIPAVTLLIILNKRMFGKISNANTSQWKKYYLKSSLLLLTFIAFVSNVSGWGESCLIYPVVFIAGVLSKEYLSFL